jgi:hypothetical protein
MKNKSWARLAFLALLGSALCLIGPAEAGGPFQYFTLTPCRLLDTRFADGPVLQDAVERRFPVQGLCDVPVGAAAVSVNVTAVSPTGPGFLTLYPSGIATPVVSTLNFASGEIALGNGAIVPLADQSVHASDLAIFPRVVNLFDPLTVHVVVDVTGFFQ